MKQLYIEMMYGNTPMRVFWDGRIDTLCKVTNQHGVKGEWRTRTDKPNNHGYLRIEIDGKMVQVHRLVMLAFRGESDMEVDHKNRDKTDNRVCNLHYVNRQENNLNRDWMDNAKGYCWDKKANKWKAYIRINGKKKHLGLFEKEEDARQAYLDAKHTLGRV